MAACTYRLRKWYGCYVIENVTKRQLVGDRHKTRAKARRQLQLLRGQK